MPIVKRTINGTEIAFAPMKVKHMRQIHARAAGATLLEGFDFWQPILQDSVERAGGTLPNFDDMEADTAANTIAQCIDALIEASGFTAPAVAAGTKN